MLFKWPHDLENNMNNWLDLRYFMVLKGKSSLCLGRSADTLGFRAPEGVNLKLEQENHVHVFID